MTDDYVFSPIKIGDWHHMGDYKNMGFDHYLNLDINLNLNLNGEWKDDDVVNKLPCDPFEMNVSGRCTMIRRWIQEVDEGIGYVNISEKSIGDAISLHDKMFDEKSKKVGNLIKNHGDGDGGEPHDAMFLALGHLGLRDLLSVERVCKSFRDGVRGDPLLWRNINIDQPVGESLNDDLLLRIMNTENGSLQSLSLVKCLRITDMGLKNVFQQNLGLMKDSILAHI